MIFGRLFQTTIRSKGVSMKKLVVLSLVCLLFFCTLFAGCSSGNGLNPNKPVTLTLWHNYGGQMKTTMDELVDAFNTTVGKEQGIILSVTSISSSAVLEEKLTMAANGDPGAPALPDITTCYPKTALPLAEKQLLVDLSTLFSEDDLSAYVPRFLEEGTIGEKLYVFPIAKSTEVLFVNQTLFDRFSAATGVSIDSLSTFEGIAAASRQYYEWTDADTPDIPNDGKSFFTADSLFNLAQVGMEQMGETLISDGQLNCSSPAYRRIWDFFMQPAVTGGIAVYDGYSSDLSKTGDIICSTGSTAGILFYGNEITYADNTTEKAEYTILPYPVFEGGKKIAIQRGGGMCVTRSTPEKEYAASLFLKWFTSSEQNMTFVSSTGYLPVTVQAFSDIIEGGLASSSEENVSKLLSSAATMQQEYDFYIPPIFDGFNEMGDAYTADLQALAKKEREEYLALTTDLDEKTAYTEASSGDFEAFIAQRS